MPPPGIESFVVPRRSHVPRSVLEAIREGQWDFEPAGEQTTVEATHALPGTTEKLDVLAERLSKGLPLWHPSDRRSFNDRDED
jgi:hypothetical protein